jgi:zinc transport system substrate-binding protein
MFGTAFCLVTSVAFAPSYGQDAGEGSGVWRLFIGDHAEPIVRAVEMNDGAIVGNFTISAPATLFASPSKRFVYAVQSSANRVSIIDTGIILDDHGDHADITVADARLLEPALMGETPIHFVVHDGMAAAFFDDEGRARLIAEGQILEGALSPRDVEAGAPHHGVAAAFGSYVLVSVPNPADPTLLPIGIKAIDANGDVVGETHACPDLHGEAASGSLLAFACGTGILIFAEGPGAPVSTFLPYPPSLPDARASTLLGGAGLQYFVGNYGADGVVVIEPGPEAAFTFVQLPTRRVAFATDPERPATVYIFTEDGQLRRLNIVTGVLDQAIALTQPYSVDGSFADPRPRIAVAGDMIVVTDPLAGLLHLVDAETFQAAGTIAVEGVPFGIVAVGGTGVDH